MYEWEGGSEGVSEGGRNGRGGREGGKVQMNQ